MSSFALDDSFHLGLCRSCYNNIPNLAVAVERIAKLGLYKGTVKRLRSDQP
ncbi:Uncharacterised protein [Mycobacteroides abscessus subsp. abscessus]|nr:Uncharacterised protein [Mycobacteroides abscessus subsp. abscessus]